MKFVKIKKQKIILWLVTALIVVLIGIEELPNQSQILNSIVENRKPGYVEVIHVDDGDTITVAINGRKEKVRFIGIDTPETQHPKKPVQCFGKAAQKFTENLIDGNQVRLEADPNNDNKDVYNRLLRYVYLPDGTLVNAEIIKEGYGFAYTLFPFSKLEEFRSYESQARENKMGLWMQCVVDDSDSTKETTPAE